MPKGDPNWVRNIYLRPSLVSIIETGGFAGRLDSTLAVLVTCRQVMLSSRPSWTAFLFHKHVSTFPRPRECVKILSFFQNRDIATCKKSNFYNFWNLLGM